MLKPRNGETARKPSSPAPARAEPQAPTAGGGEVDLQKLESLVRLLDEAFAIPGTKWRVGLDSLLGLVPGAGDLASAVMAGYVLRQSAKLGVSRLTLARMFGNVALDLAVGAVPVLGDLFDVAFKSNRRNLRLLRKHLDRSA